MAEENFSGWIGRRTEAHDTLDEHRTNALQAALGQPAVTVGERLPPLRHWLYFWDVKPPESLGADGHPARGDFLPPIALPRRMWAGGRIRFIRPLAIGEQATRVSTITAVEAKTGRTGPLVFVTVRHEVTGETGLVIEEQDLVYRDAGASAQSQASTMPASTAPWRSGLLPDPVLLFRYSALTMNGHRIHYDRSYAIEEEGYPGLVVHGPLQATMLIDLATARAPEQITTFSFRALAPAFDGARVEAFGEPLPDRATLWTEQHGKKTMAATAEWTLP